MRTQHETFVSMTIHRSRINPAPYNPRIMTRAARKRLSEGMEEFGLVEPLVWNLRTGNLVGGHQRLKELDATIPSLDYEIEVAAVDRDENDEKRLNLTLNSPFAQGEYDLEAVGAIVLSAGYQNTGFDHMDLQLLSVPTGSDVFVDDSAQGLIEAVRDMSERGRAYENARTQLDRENRDDDHLETESEEEGGDQEAKASQESKAGPGKGKLTPAEIEKIKQVKRDYAAKVATDNANLESYIVVVFRHRNDFIAVKALLNAPEDGYLDGEQLRAEIARRIAARDAAEAAHG